MPCRNRENVWINSCKCDSLTHSIFLMLYPLFFLASLPSFLPPLLHYSPKAASPPEYICVSKLESSHQAHWNHHASANKDHQRTTPVSTTTATTTTPHSSSTTTTLHPQTPSVETPNKTHLVYTVEAPNKAHPIIIIIVLYLLQAQTNPIWFYE